MTVAAIDAFARAGLAPEARSAASGFGALIDGTGRSDATRRTMDWIAETRAHLTRQAEAGAPPGAIADTEKLLGELNKLLVVRMMSDALFGAEEDAARPAAPARAGAGNAALSPAALAVLADADAQ